MKLEMHVGLMEKQKWDETIAKFEPAMHKSYELLACHLTIELILHTLCPTWIFFEQNV